MLTGDTVDVKKKQKNEMIYQMVVVRECCNFVQEYSRLSLYSYRKPIGK